jgi:hypothetical protein
MQTAADACLFLSELMTAREYRTRFGPETLESMADLDAVLKKETERAAVIAKRRGLRASVAGRYPLAIWKAVAASR